MTKCNAKFRDSILLRCYNALEAEGFERFRKRAVDFPLGNGFRCWVGLNTGLYEDHFTLTPFVGVHVESIAKIACIGGTKYDRSVATYAIPMGELPAAENEPAFAFDPSQSNKFVSDEASRLADLYRTIGVDFANSIASYENLLPFLSQREDMLGGYPQRVASCLYLMDRRNEAIDYVKRIMSEEPDYFESFSEPFLKMINQENTQTSNTPS